METSQIGLDEQGFTTTYLPGAPLTSITTQKRTKHETIWVIVTLCLSRLLWSENIGLHSNLLNPHCMMSLSLDLTGSENRWCRLTLKFRTDIFCSLGYKPTTVRGEPLAPLWASVKKNEIIIMWYVDRIDKKVVRLPTKRKLLWIDFIVTLSSAPDPRSQCILR